MIDGVIWKYTKIPVLLSFRKTNILNSTKETIVEIKNTLTRQEHNTVQKSMEKYRCSSGILLAGQLIRSKVLTGSSNAVEKCRSQSWKSHGAFQALPSMTVLLIKMYKLPRTRDTSQVMASAQCRWIKANRVLEGPWQAGCESCRDKHYALGHSISHTACTSDALWKCLQGLRCGLKQDSSSRRVFNKVALRISVDITMMSQLQNCFQHF